MKLHRVRFTVRRLMVVVAIVGITSGLAVWCAKMHRLSRSYLARSGYYELRYDANPPSPSAKVRDWEWQMMMKYQRLAMTPWNPVEPDPPEPK